MKRFAQFAAAAALVVGVSTTAAAQDTTMTDEGMVVSQPFFLAPTFALLPSALSTNVISAPDGIDSHTAFNARFQAVVPTRYPWFALVGGAQWGPVDEDDQGAIIFLGGIIPIVPLNNATANLLTFSVDPLLVATGPGGDGMDFVLEGAAVLNFGSMLMSNTPFFSGLSAFFLLDQNLTPEEDITGDKDFWNPVLIYGLSIPIAPWPGGSR